jgi:hypothetical protein
MTTIVAHEQAAALREVNRIRQLADEIDQLLQEYRDDTCRKEFMCRAAQRVAAHDWHATRLVNSVQRRCDGIRSSLKLPHTLFSSAPKPIRIAKEPPTAHRIPPSYCSDWPEGSGDRRVCICNNPYGQNVSGQQSYSSQYTSCPIDPSQTGYEYVGHGEGNYRTWVMGNSHPRERPSNVGHGEGNYTPQRHTVSQRTP